MELVFSSTYFHYWFLSGKDLNGEGEQGEQKQKSDSGG